MSYDIVITKIISELEVLFMIEVVAGIIYKDGKFLIAQRNLKKAQGGLWEFPGGKVEVGETNQEALKREIKEEFNAEINVKEFVGEIVHHYPEKDIRLNFYKADLIGENFELLEHEACSWIIENELYNYEFAEADKEIIHNISF